jgi:hypothetical protein
MLNLLTQVAQVDGVSRVGRRTGIYRIDPATASERVA